MSKLMLVFLTIYIYINVILIYVILITNEINIKKIQYKYYIKNFL